MGEYMHRIVWIVLGIWAAIGWAAVQQPMQREPVLRAVRKVPAEQSSNVPVKAQHRVAPPEVRVRCGILRVVSRPEDGHWDPQTVWYSNKATFSVRRVLDLLFVMAFPEHSVPGDRVIRFIVRTPRGRVYQKIDVPLGTPGRTPGVRMLPGYRYPLKESPARMVRGPSGRMVVTAVPFPVGGTVIQQNGLYGTWRVEADVMRTRRPCAVATFVLQP